MKKYTKFWVFVVIFFLSLFFGKETKAAYSDEGVAFYAQTTPPAYTAEGIAFYAFQAQQDGTVPVYRFRSTITGDHFYTTSEDEKTSVTTNTQWGYVSEGIAFYTNATKINESCIPVYRFRSTITGDHFYTASENEKSAILNNAQWGYVFEGAVFYAQSTKTSENSSVYRFMNPSNGDHFYTTSEAEKNNISLSPVFRFINPSSGDHFYTASVSEKTIVANTSMSGYYPEGIAFYAPTTQISNTLPVYRFLNNLNGDHFYTASESEKTAVLNNPQWGYTYESIAFYAPTTQLSGYSPVYRLNNSQTGDHFYTASLAEKNRLLIPALGSEISVGLWNYSKSGLQTSPFKIDADKDYVIKDSNGNIVSRINKSTTTKVTYYKDSYLKAYESISSTKSKKIFYFEAADGDNSSIKFDVHRPDSSFDHYRGKIKVQYNTTDGNIWIINTLPLEHYVWGMGETTGTGDLEHTKVMTTIFRTYGFWYIKYANKYAPYGFKIRSDSGSQIYKGYDWEKSYPNIKKAAQQTRAIIATYDGDVALTPYSSWSAGKTRSYESVWGSSEYPWCKSVDDSYGNYNNSYWDHSSTKSQSTLISEGNHMVGLIAHGSLYLAEEKNWNFDQIMKYYYSGIKLPTNY